MRTDRRAVEPVCEYLLRVDGDLNIHGTVKEEWWMWVDCCKIIEHRRYWSIGRTKAFFIGRVCSMKS